MYTSYRDDQISMLAFDIPPRAVEGLDPGLRKLNEMQFLIEEVGGIDPLIEAIRGASDEQISLAQGQIDFAVREIEKHMTSHSVAMTMKERGLLSSDVKDARDGISKAITVIMNDAVDAMRACDKKPGDEGKLRYLDAVLEALAEAVVVTRAIATASDDVRDRTNVDAAQIAWGEITSQSNAFREDVGPRYSAQVQSNLRHSSDLMAAAQANAAASTATLPELTLRRMQMTVSGLDSTKVLRWNASRGEVKPLREGHAAKLREDVVSLFNDYQQVYSKPGFLRLLQAAAVTAHWGAESRNDQANNPTKDEDRAKQAYEKDGKSLYGHGPNPTSVAEHLYRMQNWRGMARREGERETALAASYGGLIALANQTLHPDQPLQRVMTFRLDEASGATVGEFSGADAATPALLIYDDAGCGGYPSAVLMVSMPHAAIEEGIPSIESARNHVQAKGSNYRSFADAISGLSNQFDREYFVGEAFVIANPGSIPRPTNEPEFLDRLTPSEMAIRNAGGEFVGKRSDYDDEEEDDVVDDIVPEAKMAM